ALYMRQIAVADQLGERRYRAHLGAALLRIGADQRFSRGGARLAARHRQRDHVGGTDLELALATPVVGVALVVGFAAGLSDLEHEAALLAVEEIDLLHAVGTDGRSDKRSGQTNAWHGQNH